MQLKFVKKDTRQQYARYTSGTHNSSSLVHKLDACHAMANAVLKCFPNCKIIMCFFHVKTNIRKRKHKLP